MKLEQLRLKGFMRFTREVALDLTTIPDGSLVAVVGGNGEGKSTLLDAGAAVLHLAMPSREGALATYATGRDSYLEATYAIEGRGRYRARVNVDGEKRSSDAVLEELLDGGLVGRLNDGKVTTYRKAVDGLFPAPELLLASAFAPQNRAGSFVDAKPAQRKDLFSRLLGLELLERYADTAKACAAIVDTTVARLRDRRDTLGRLTTQELAQALASRGTALQQQRQDAEDAEVAQGRRIEALQVTRTALEATVRTHQAALERVRSAEAEFAGVAMAIGGARRQLEQVASDFAAAVTRAQDLADRRERELTAEDEASQRACAETVMALEERIAGNKTLASRADEIRKAAADKVTAEADLETWRGEEATARKALDAALEQIDMRRRKLEEAVHAERELAVARTQAELIATVPCRGEVLYLSESYSPIDAVDAGTCQFLQNAKSAQARIPEWEGKAQHAASLRDGIEYWTGQSANARALLAAASEQVNACKALIASLAPTARYAEQLAATEERIAGYRREQEAAQGALAAALDRITLARSTAAAEHASAHQAAILEHDLRRLNLLADLDVLEAKRTAADAAIQTARAEEAETAGADAKLAAVDGDLAAARDAQARAIASRASAAAALEAWTVEHERFTRQVGEHHLTVAKVRTAEDELLAWQTLQRCFGRDGLPTLEIGNAGPTVSALTNDLLNVGFGPRFTVDVVTQVARADGKGVKEEFTIRVFDNAEGGEPRDIADLSGGERVLVEEALRAAIALFVNSRNVQPVRTIWRDETTGALDPDNAVRYVAMLRRVQELGGIAHVLFVTHNPDCAALADAQVLVADGQLTVRRPPFSQAA